MAILPPEAFQFCSGTYQAVSSVLDSERAVNLYPEKSPPSAKEQVALIGTPGLLLFMTLPHVPVRALWAGNGRLFAVGGTHFYEVDSVAGTVVTDYGAMGASTGTGPCRVVSNGTQLLVMDSSIGQIFNANPGGPSMDFVFSGFDLEYLDTFFFALNAAVQNGVNNSASSNGGSWPALNAIQRTTTVDQVCALVVVNSNLWIFGAKTITPYYDVGTSGFPLALIQGGTIQQGALSPPSGRPAAFHALKASNTVFWIGADDRGFGEFYKAQGLLPVRISTPGVSSLLSSYGDISGARGFAYTEDAHLFCVWNFPNANGGVGATLVYDDTTGMWHERMYLNGSTAERWRPDCFASLEFGTGATNFVGDYQNGNIYKMSLSYTGDNNNNIQRIRTAPIIAANNQWLAHGSLQIDADIGTAAMVLTMSNDGARSFLSNSYTIPKTGTSAASGINTYMQNKLGRSRQRVYRLTITDKNNPIRLIAALADVHQ